MSKKIIAFLLVCVMAFAAANALAATDITIDTGLPEFDVHFAADMDVPVESTAGDGYCMILFGDPNLEDPNQMIYMATLTISDETVFEGRDLTEATDEELGKLFNVLVSADEGGENPYTYEVRDLDDGVRALVIINQDTHEDVWVFTVKSGVLVQVFGFYMDNHALAEQDIQNALTLMDKLEFVPKSDSSLKVGQ